MDPLEKIIRPIVEGQIRGFLKEHPKVVEAVDWYKPRPDKALTFTNSLAKRIRQSPSGQQRQQPTNGADIERLGFTESEQRYGCRTAGNGRGESSNASLAFEGMGNAPRQPPWECGQPWQQSEAAECDDGWRRIEPGAQPLGHGIPSRLDKISGYGNAIVPQVAAKFIAAYTECCPS